MEKYNLGTLYPSRVKCNPCLFRERPVDAVNWCSTCFEGLCDDCSRTHKTGKTQRKHSFIPVEEYMSSLSSELEIQTWCHYHPKKLDLYCPVHDIPMCELCSKETHKDCSDIIRIDEVAKHTKDSALSDLEKSLLDTKRNIENILRFNLQNKKSLVTCKSAVQKDVQNIRTTINEHLDKLETRLLQELETTYKKCLLDINTSMIALENDMRSVNVLTRTTDNVKQATSETQCFIGTKVVERKLLPLTVKMEKLMMEIQKFEISATFESVFSEFTTKISSIGKIEVHKSPISMPIENFKHRQAQIPILVSESCSKNEIFLRTQQIPVLPNETNLLITGCLILPSDQFLFTHRNKHCLFIQDKFGAVARSIGVSGSPYDVEYIDENTIVVSYGSLAYVEVIQSSSGEIIRRVPVGGYCSGICFEVKTSRIYALVRNKGICIVSLSGHIYFLIKNYHIDTGYVAVTTDKLVYTDIKHRCLHCHDLQGNELWTFHLDEIQSPRGIQIDIRGCILVVDSELSQLLLISAEGGSRQVVLESHGLNKPVGLKFSGNKKELLICNSTDGQALLCKLR